MCGRYAIYSPADKLSGFFGVDFEAVGYRPRYNVAPMQNAPIIRANDSGRRVDMLRWGLVPSWAKDEKLAARLINARAETVAEKPAFRAAYRRRRALVPMDGFYEWQPVAGGKQPYFIGLDSTDPIALAGLWEHWQSPQGEKLETFTILTTEANSRVRELHHRMPVIVAPEHWDIWLDDSADSPALSALLAPYPSDPMATRAVSRRVGNVRNDDASLLELV